MGMKEKTIDALIEEWENIQQPCHRCTLPDYEYEVHLKLCPMQPEYAEAASRRYQHKMASNAMKAKKPKKKRSAIAQARR